MKTKETQLKKVRNHLLKFKQITSWDAIKLYRITRLSHYILLLRQDGFNIGTDMVYPKNENHYGIYKLIED